MCPKQAVRIRPEMKSRLAKLGRSDGGLAPTTKGRWWVASMRGLGNTSTPRVLATGGRMRTASAMVTDSACSRTGTGTKGCGPLASGMGRAATRGLRATSTRYSLPQSSILSPFSERIGALLAAGRVARGGRGRNGCQDVDQRRPIRR